MKLVKKLTISIFVLMITLFTGSCTVNKKKKCDTCPKWDRYDVEIGNEDGFKAW